MQTLRHISLYGMLLSRDETGFSDEYLNRSTSDDLEESLKRFEEWWDHVAVKYLPQAEMDAGYDAILNMRNAYENQAREDGIRTGLRLLHEALCDVPNIMDIEKRRWKNE